MDVPKVATHSEHPPHRLETSTQYYSGFRIPKFEWSPSPLCITISSGFADAHPTKEQTDPVIFISTISLARCTLLNVGDRIIHTFVCTMTPLTLKHRNNVINETVPVFSSSIVFVFDSWMSLRRISLYLTGTFDKLRYLLCYMNR